MKLQCIRCRVKESLFASLWTGLLGWWSVYGLFWTLEALVKNACGGEQPKPNNAALLKAISYQLYQQGRLREAHEALLAGLKLEPDPNAAPTMEFFRREVGLPQKKPFWERFRGLELYPAFYHAPVALAALGLIIYLLCGTEGTQASPQASPTTYVSGTSAAPVAPAPAQHPSVQFLEPEIPLPEVALLIPGARMALPLSCTAPLTIKTRASDGNYVVKVVDWYTGEFVGMFFIRSGHTLSTALPLGTYKLKFACGQKWYGPNYLFGPETLYSYADERLTFYLSANYREGHSIELIPQVGGNLRTKQLSSVDW